MSKRVLLCLVFIIVVSGAVYFNALFNEFVFDDLQLITNNDTIKDFRYIPEIFTENLWGVLGRASNYYRPLPPLIYMLIYHIFGSGPWAFHLVNILFHAGVSLLIYFILSHLVKKDDRKDARSINFPAFLAALLFAVHPIHTEAVAWIAGIMDLSCTFFSLLSFYLFIRFQEGTSSIKILILSLFSFFLAVLSKEPALTISIILIIYAVLFRRPSDRDLLHSLKRCVLYFLVIGVYFAMRLYALKGFAPLKTSSGLSLYETLINISFIFARYLEKMFMPVSLNVLYHVHPISSLFSMQGLISLLVTLLFFAIMFTSFKRNKTLLLGLLFIVVPLLPALYLPGLVQKIEYAVTDRYLYLSSFGLVILVAAFISSLERKNAKWSKGMVLLASAVIAVFSVMTISRNAVWKNNETLWRDSVQKSPESAFAHENLGYALFYRGNAEEGRRELQTAVKLDSGIPDAIISTGIGYSQKGLMNHAILAFNRAVLLKPDSADAHYNLGLAYHTKGWQRQAIEQYETALMLNPDYTDAHNNLGIAYGESGSADKAIEHFLAALRLNPDDASFHYNLARAYDMKGWKEKAEAERRTARNLQTRKNM